MAKRYQQLIDLVALYKPGYIVEVGVHKAKRSVAMCQEATKYQPVTYVGFDVFDTMGDQFQADALNGKGTPTEAQARAALSQVPRLQFELKVGDTRQTLHRDKAGGAGVQFAFIDGDHRVDAIRGDYLALSDCPVVVLDDFYRPGPNGELPDLDKYGANQLVCELLADGVNVEILPTGDPCNHGAVTYLAVVRK